MVTVSKPGLDSEDNILPPAYTPLEPTPITSHERTSGSPSAVLALRAPPTNFLNVSRTNHAIKGTYVLDLSMPPLPSALPHKDSNGRPLNMRLNSTNGAVDVVVAILRTPSIEGPALLEASTTNGSIKFKVEDDKQQHFQLRAATTNGAITVHLPPTYNGIISAKQMNGSLVLSPVMQARIVKFPEEGCESRFFVGDYRASGFVDDASWKGDSVHVEAHNGRVKIRCADEPEEETASFLKRFFWG